jgi:hypothetical protein
MHQLHMRVAGIALLITNLRTEGPCTVGNGDGCLPVPVVEDLQIRSILKPTCHNHALQMCRSGYGKDAACRSC